MIGVGTAIAWRRWPSLAFRGSYHANELAGDVEALRTVLTTGAAAGRGTLRPAPVSSLPLADAMGSSGCVTLAEAKWRSDAEQSAVDFSGLPQGTRIFEARLSNGFPFVGLIASHGDARRHVVTYAHGIATTPQLALGSNWWHPAGEGAHPLWDYGHDVIVPFIPNSGNLRSVAQLWLLAASHGISLHHCLVSMLSACVDVADRLLGPRQGRRALFGASLGAYLSTHAMALDDRFDALVVSGYAQSIRHALRSDEYQRLAATGDIYPGIYQRELNDFGLARCAGLIAPRPMLIEYGQHDGMAGLAFGTVDELSQARQANPNLSIRSFDGGHEADSARAVDWLQQKLGAA